MSEHLSASGRGLLDKLAAIAKRAMARVVGKDERRWTEQEIAPTAAEQRAAAREQASAQRAAIEKAEAQAEAARLVEKATRPPG